MHSPIEGNPGVKGSPLVNKRVPRCSPVGGNIGPLGNIGGPSLGA